MVGLLGRPSRSYKDVEHDAEGLSAAGSRPFMGGAGGSVSGQSQTSTNKLTKRAPPVPSSGHTVKTYRPSLTEMHFKRQQMHDPFSSSAKFNLGRKNKEQARAGQRAELNHILEPGYKSSYNTNDDDATSVAGPSRLSSVRTAGGLSALSRRKDKGNGDDNLHRSGSMASFANGNAGGAKKTGVYLDSTGRLHDTEYDPFAGVAELSRRRSKRRGAMRGRRGSASSSESTGSSEDSVPGRGQRTLSRGSAGTDDPDRDREEIRRRLDQERRKLDEVSGYAAARRRSMMSDRASGQYSGRGTPSLRSGHEDNSSLHPSIAPSVAASARTAVTNGGRTPRATHPSPLSPTLSKSSKAQSAVSGGSGASAAAESQKSIEDSPRKHTETVHSTMPPPLAQRSVSDRTITAKTKDHLAPPQDPGEVSDDEATDDNFEDAADDVNHVEEEGAADEEQQPINSTLQNGGRQRPRNGHRREVMEEEGSEPDTDHERDRDVKFHEPIERVHSLQPHHHEPIERVHSHASAPAQHSKHPRSVSSKGRLERPGPPQRTVSHDYDRPLYAEVDMVRELPLLKPRAGPVKPVKQHSGDTAVQVIRTYAKDGAAPAPPKKDHKGPTRVTGGFESVPLPKARVTGGFDAPRRPSGAPSSHSVANSILQGPGSIRSGVSSHSDEVERRRRPKPAERPREQLFPETPAQIKRREERERRELRSGRTSAGKLAADSVATSSRSRILPEIEIVDDDDPRIVFPPNGPSTHGHARGHTFRAPSLSASALSPIPGDHSGPTSLRSAHHDDTSSRSLAYHDSSRAPSAIIEESGGGYLPSRWANGDKNLRLTEEEKERYRPREWGGRRGDLGGRPDHWHPTAKEEVKSAVKDISTNARFSMFRAKKKLLRKTEW